MEYSGSSGSSLVYTLPPQVDIVEAVFSVPENISNEQISQMFPGIVFTAADPNAPTPVGWTLVGRFVFRELDRWIFRQIGWLLQILGDDRDHNPPPNVPPHQ